MYAASVVFQTDTIEANCNKKLEMQNTPLTAMNQRPIRNKVTHEDGV